MTYCCVPPIGLNATASVNETYAHWFRASDVRRLFALTTQAADWFLEQGFAKTEVDALPVDRKALYSYRRNSHVLVKNLAGKPGPASDDGNPASKFDSSDSLLPRSTGS